MHDWVIENSTPAWGRQLVVEILSCTMDFKSWQASLGVKLTGLVNTHWKKHANHVWRFVKRGDTGGYNGSDQWDIKPGCYEWKDLEPHPDDVIAL